MIYKVLYQESKTEVLIRENTRTIFVEGESERDIRRKLAGRTMNIEFIQPMDAASLEYEKRSEKFEVEKL